MSVPLGLDCKLYYNDGTYDSPDWQEMTSVKDVTLGVEKNTADVTTRGNDGWRAIATALKDGTIDFQMNWDTTKDDFSAVQDAFFNDTTLELAVMDGDITDDGSEGLRATCEIVTFNRNEPLEEAVTVDVQAKPALATNPPEWYVVGESS